MDDATRALLRRVTDETRAVASHGTAAQLWGMRLRHPAGPTVTVARARSKVRREGVAFRRGRVDDVWSVDGIRVTGRLQTVLDCTRSLRLPEGVVVADSALESGLVLPAQLTRAAAEARGPGSARIRQAAGLADGRAQSVPETLLRLVLLARPELGRVVPQFRFAPGSHAYDLGLPELCTVVEFQSFAHHRERAQLLRDARWGNEAHAHGWGYVQVVWDDLVQGVDHVVGLVLGRPRP